MATVQVCDGCGGHEGPMESLGHVIIRDYCPECANDVKEHLAALDAEHEGLANAWKNTISDLDSEWAVNHTGTLPDR